MAEEHQYEFETLQIHEGHSPDSETNARGCAMRVPQVPPLDPRGDAGRFRIAPIGAWFFKKEMSRASSPSVHVT